jgi:DNA-3-methyladenine glycosylase I
MEEPRRCPWVGDDPLARRYHDLEWGVPLDDPRGLFELLTLEGAQTGLSWMTILRKRDRYREVFAGFDPRTVAGWEARRVDTLLADPGIVRHRGKIEATLGNARAFLELESATGCAAAHLWSFVGGVPRQNAWRTLEEIPSRTRESEAMSRDLRRRGFRFVGPTTCYALMQASGMVNDHTVGCFRYRALRSGSGKVAPKPLGG